MDEMEELFKKLTYAQGAVKILIECNENCSVDFHDIVYWASEIKRLRTEITNKL